MKNQEIAKIFFQIADFMKMEGIAFKPQAYIRVALNLESLNEDVGEIYAQGGIKSLLEISGIGKSMAGHIEEYLKNGKIKDYEKMKKSLPLQIDELIRVEGVGPRKVKILYQKLFF